MSDAAWDRIKQSIDNLRRGEMPKGCTGTTKLCTGPCKRVLPIEQFHRRTDRPVGRQSRCRDCLKTTGKKRADYRGGGSRPAYVPCPSAPAFNAWLRIRGADTGPVGWTIRRAA